MNGELLTDKEYKFLFKMNTYLVNTFNYNRAANNKLLEKINQLSNKAECIKLFSHLVNCQVKWMARIKQEEGAVDMSWWEPIYKPGEMQAAWEKSIDLWIKYINETTEEVLLDEVTFIG
ncbi:MAG: hypothetical protein ABIT58_05250, partial [Ferruginibacter sp.]